MARTVQVEHSRAPRLRVGEPIAAKAGEQSARGSTDRELWDADLAWFLCSAPAALGERGSLAAVIAAIERGGASSSSDHDHHTDAQLGGRWGRFRGSREGEVERARRLGARWRLVPAAHRRILEAHYLGSSWRPRDDRGEPVTTVGARLGELAAVATLIWSERAARRPASARKRERELDNRASELRAELEALERRMDELEPALRQARQARRYGFRRRSWAWLRSAPARAAYAEARSAARALRSELDATLSELGEVTREPGLHAHVLALVRACKAGEPPGLRVEAERAIRRAHRAWYAAGRRVCELELDE